VTQFLFVTDLDNTFVGDDQALAKLTDKLSQHRQKYGTRIVYATGRSPLLYQELKEETNLLDPDGLILSVGTEIYLDGTDTPDTHWAEKLASGWSRDVILSTTARFPQLEPQPDSEQRQFKVSFYLEQEDSQAVLPQLEAIFQAAGLDIQLIYSSDVDLDVVPRQSGKGLAVQFLRQKWNFGAEQTVVCGDSGNDITLFAVGNERGIIVGNARPELLNWYNNNPADYRYLAKNFCAGGILEGLQYFGFLND